jgi:hypothetical protein
MAASAHSAKIEGDSRLAANPATGWRGSGHAYSATSVGPADEQLFRPTVVSSSVMDTTTLIIIIVVIVLLLGGGGYWYRGRR